eukprot:g397.t1
MAAGLLTLAFWATAALEGREGQVTVLDDVAVANTAAKAHTYKARMQNKRVLTSKANRIDDQHGYDAPNSSDGAGSRNGDDSRGEPERMVDADGFPLEYILDAPATMSNSSATKPSRGNTCLITVVDDKTKEAYGATLASIVDNRLLYCARNQYTHLFFKPENISQEEMHGRLGYWRKVVAIQAAFTRHDCAYAVFLDTDVVIMHAQPFDDIYAEMDAQDKHIALAKNGGECRGVLADVGVFSPHALTCGDWNTGALIVKRTPESLALVAKWNEIELYERVEAYKVAHDMWLNDQLGLRLLIQDSRELEDMILVVPRQRLNTFFCLACDLFVNEFEVSVYPDRCDV